jgi:protein tyrosine/serine phosphatase
MRTGIALAFVAVAAAAIWLTIETRRNRLVLDHFDVVKHGILYRSGQLNPDQLTDVVARYGIRTVINFQIAGDRVEAERALAHRLKVDFLNLPMPGDGFGQEPQFREVLKACDDPARRPVLIHCARGTCRTGAAVALYRFERDGWTIQDVAAEMRRQTYREGWLPGYVYGMVKAKPGQDLFDPAIRWDHNLAVDVVPDRANGIGPPTIPPRGFEPSMADRTAAASKNAVQDQEATDVR